jgi:two-component system OmpR family response regulator
VAAPPLPLETSRSGDLPWRPSGSPGNFSARTSPFEPTIVFIGEDNMSNQARIDYLRSLTFQVVSTNGVLKAPRKADLFIVDGQGPFREQRRFYLERRSLAGSRVIVIDDSGDRDQRIEALEAGADDVVASTCADRELWSRIKAVLGLNRHAPPAAMHWTGVVYAIEDIGDFIPADMTLRVADGVVLRLNRSECGLLERLVKTPRAMVTRDEILEALPDDAADVFDRTVDLRVSRLRKRLAPHGGEQMIQTCRGAGYRLNADVRRSSR